MIIGITGKMQNGKDTLGKIIKQNYPEYEIIHFADALKQICVNYLGLTDYQVNTGWGKKEFNEFWGMTNRQILQKVGTDAMRNGFCEDVWCKVMSLRLKEDKNYIVPDVRFDDQAKMLLDKGGIIIKINRESVNNTNENHKSQKGISEEFITCHIQNDGTIEELKQKFLLKFKDFKW